MADILGNFDDLNAIKPESFAPMVQLDEDNEDDEVAALTAERKTVSRRLSSWTRKKLFSESSSEKVSNYVAELNLAEAEAIRAEKKQKDADEEKRHRKNGVMALMAKKKGNRTSRNGTVRSTGLSNLYSEVDLSENGTPRGDRELLTDSPVMPSFLLEQEQLEKGAEDEAAASKGNSNSNSPRTKTTAPPAQDIVITPEMASNAATSSIGHFQGVIDGMRNALSSGVNTKLAYNCAGSAELSEAIFSLEALRSVVTANLEADPAKVSMKLFKIREKFVESSDIVNPSVGVVGLGVSSSADASASSSEDSNADTSIGSSSKGGPSRRMSTVPMHEASEESSRISSEKYANTILGSRIQVMDDEKKWHDGIICRYKVVEKKHEVIFDDGVRADVELSDQPVRLED